MNNRYKQAECFQCGVELVVPTHDYSERNYCQPCAFSKLGYVRIPNSANNVR